MYFRILCRLVCVPERLEGHSIPTEPGHPPTFKQMYRLSPLEYRELEKQVTAFLKAGIIEPSQSPYGAPVLFVPKPNGRGLRLCVDYRALNSITVKNRATLPRIDDLLDAVSGSQYFTSFGSHVWLPSNSDFSRRLSDDCVSHSVWTFSVQSVD